MYQNAAVAGQDIKCLDRLHATLAMNTIPGHDGCGQGVQPVQFLGYPHPAFVGVDNGRSQHNLLDGFDLWPHEIGSFRNPVAQGAFGDRHMEQTFDDLGGAQVGQIVPLIQKYGSGLYPRTVLNGFCHSGRK